VNDEREKTAERLQELLEGDLPADRREEIERWAALSPHRERELERLRRLDGLLGEAVPEPWSTSRTERVLDGLGVRAEAARGRLLRMILTAAAAVAALAIWGGPVLSRVHAAPDRVRQAGSGLVDGLTMVTAGLPSIPPGPVAGLAVVVLLVTLVVGARTARTLASEEDFHV
jgi:ferric-dicitrate binding protein FerR (iron transport regulator)